VAVKGGLAAARGVAQVGEVTGQTTADRVVDVEVIEGHGVAHMAAPGTRTMPPRFSAERIRDVATDRVSPLARM